MVSSSATRPSARHAGRAAVAVSERTPRCWPASCPRRRRLEDAQPIANASTASVATATCAKLSETHSTYPLIPSIENGVDGDRRVGSGHLPDPGADASRARASADVRWAALFWGLEPAPAQYRSGFGRSTGLPPGSSWRRREIRPRDRALSAPRSGAAASPGRRARPPCSPRSRSSARIESAHGRPVALGGLARELAERRAWRCAA